MSTSAHRSGLKNAFSPDIGVDASFQVLDILKYACGHPPFGTPPDGKSPFAGWIRFALISNENPHFETTSEDRRLLSRGFTLAEILIAIAIFALLVSIIMGSFNGVFSKTEALGVQRLNNAMARSCLMRMATDLGNVYVEKPPFFTPPGTLEAPSIYRFVARNTTDAADSEAILQFASRAHVDFSGQHQQGIAVIRYFLEPVNKGDTSTFLLRRSDVLVDGDDLPETASDPILCENILTLQLACIGGDGEASEAWDSSSQDQSYATPRAVRIRLELFAPEGPSVYETIVPLPLWRAASGKV